MQNVDDLNKMSKGELLDLWRKLLGKQLPPSRIDRLIREIAYTVQEQRHGRLDKNTIVSLRRHMAEYEKALEAGKAAKAVKTPAKIKLEAGSVLSRKWNGRQITVKIIATNEFEFEGRRYKSLSRIARTVTSQHVSGPLFFGLKEVNRG